jgi:hypothetical protein
VRLKHPKVGTSRAHVICWSVVAVAMAIVLVISANAKQPPRTASPSSRHSVQSADLPSAGRAAWVIADRAVRQFADRARQGKVAAYGEVPFASFSLRPKSVKAANAADLPSGRFTLPVQVRYRLAGADTKVHGVVPATFTRHGHHWSVNGALGLPTDLWAYQPVRVARTGHVMVIGADRFARRLRSLSRQASHALHAVEGFWGSRPSADVVVVVPGSPHVMDAVVGSSSAQHQPAIATWHALSSGGYTRVTLNAREFFNQSRLGKQILLRHEFTHVMQNSLRPDDPPLWLVEGLADFVAYRGTHIPVSVVASDLIRRVKAGHVPDRLPSDGRFDLTLSQRSRRVAYESGWSMCQLLAASHGQHDLLRFYRAVALGHGSSRRRFDTAARSVFGIDGSALLQQWQSWLGEQR